jgi:CBS domain-containing protein
MRRLRWGANAGTELVPGWASAGSGLDLASAEDKSSRTGAVPEEASMLRVQQLMNHNVHVCRPDDSLQFASRLMWDNDIGVVVVVNDAGYPVAMLTDRDACMGACLTGLPLSEIPVRRSMSRKLISVRRDQPVEDAALLMRDNQVRRLPVLDDAGRLVGLLSQNDLIHEAAREREGRRKDLNPMSITTVLAWIGRSRTGQLARQDAFATSAP